MVKRRDLREENSWAKGTASQAAENSGPGRKDVPQGLKPNVFSIIYGPTKVVP
jgi:hypothetical protein